MPLTEQEHHCVKLACEFLSQEYAGSWTFKDDLDLLNPNRPSPEVLVGNGTLTAAIEVKRLKGDAEFQSYLQALVSNWDYLAPSCGGHYCLVPGTGVVLPFDHGLRKHLKKEIERVAKLLSPGQSGVIQVPRHGQISCTAKGPPSMVSCLRHGVGELLMPLREQVLGRFLLIDDEPEHAFLTEAGRKAFQEAVVAACERRLMVEELIPVDWCEEWQLTRVEGYDTNRVEVVAATRARGVQEAVKECVEDMLEKALRKFVGVRWGDLHVLVLESEFSFANEEMVTNVLEAFPVEELSDLDLVLLVHDEEAKRIWSKTSSPSATERKERATSELTIPEAEFIIQNPVSERRKIEFLENFLTDRQTAAATEMLFRRTNAFQQETIRPGAEDMPWSGHNVLLQKAPFMDLPNWAPYRSWDFAVAMELHLMARLEAALRGATEGCLGDQVNRDAASVLGAFDAMAAQLRLRRYAPTVFVLAGPLGTQLAVDLQKAVVGTWQEVEQALSTTFRVLGIYAGIPILHIAECPLPGVYAVDVARFARLTRYGIHPEFAIEEITSQRGRDLLAKNPTLVSNPPVAAGMEEERLRQLLLRVSLQLFETYELAVLDSEAVVGCPLTGPVLEWQPGS